MPPKKAPPKKGQESEPTGPEIPMNTCNFKIEFEVKHEVGHYLKVKFDWIHIDPATSEINFPQIDTGFLKEWTLLQIEGQEPTELEESQPDTSQNNKSGRAAPKKPDPKKGAKAGVLEEITETRPMTVKFVRDCAMENNGEGLEVNEDVAIKFSQFKLKLEIWETERETQVETLQETIYLDLSSLLFPDSPIDYHVRFDRLKSMQLHYLNISIQSDSPMLSEFYRKKLNPLQINLVGVKDIPFKTEPKYKPIFASVEFVDGYTFNTLEMPQQKHCRFMQKHVILAGLIEPVQLKELLQTRSVKVLLHDNDEYVQDSDADQNFSVGQASFSFKDYLRPFTKELKLRSDVFPLKRATIDQSGNLHLNVTAKKNERAVEKFSPYLVNSTYAVLQANLSYPIGSFNLFREMQALEQAALDKTAAEEEEKLQQQPPGTAGSKLTSQPTQTAMSKKTGDDLSQRPKSKGNFDIVSQGSIAKETIDNISQIDQASMMGSNFASNPIFDVNGQIYERMVIVLPYKAADSVKTIENVFERINLECLNLESARYLNTKELSGEEIANRHLDYMCGFEIIDSEFRMFIVEGCGGPMRSMEQFYRANERSRPNDKKFKMLYNPQVRFKNRLYTDFNVAMKRIRLRDPLTKIMKSPDIYLRSKVSQQMYDTLQKFAEIRKLDRIGLVRDFNLFPIPENLLTLERKYGDSLSAEDITGQKPRKRRRTTSRVSLGDNRTEMASDNERLTTIVQSRTDMTSDVANRAALKPEVQSTKMREDEDSEAESDWIRAPKKLKADTDCKNNLYDQTIRNRTQVSSHDFIGINRETLKGLSQGRPPKARIDVPDGFEVHQYGNQKNNIWEIQKEQMRKVIANDPEHFYTYSKDCLSGSFPIVNENEIKMKAKLESEARWLSKRGFDNIGKRTNWNEHPKKPDLAKIENLKYPHVKQATDTKAKLQSQAYRPSLDGKPEFLAKKISQQTFSTGDYFKTVFTSGDNMEKELAEEKERLIQEWEKKVVVTNKHFTVNTRVPKSNQYEKYRGVLQGKATKVGLILPRSRLTQMAGRQITMTKSLADLPVSSMMKEPYVQNETESKPMKAKVDFSKTPFDKTRGEHETRDFNRYVKVNPSAYSKIPIKPLTTVDKVGPKYYNRSSNNL